SQCAWLDTSKEGLVLTVSGAQEVWVLDPKTFKVKHKIDAPGVTRAVSSPQLSVALSCNRDELRVLDLKKGAEVKKYKARDLGNLVAFLMPVVTPDGKYLFAQGWLEQLQCFTIKGN